MFKKMIKVLGRVVFAFFVLYSFNLLAAPISMNIPINLLTIFGIAILGFPALLSLIVIFLIIM